MHASRSLRAVSISLALATPGLGPNTAPAEQPPGLPDSVVLRHRVQIVAVPPLAAQPQPPQGISTILLKSDAWKALLIQEGITISETDWASALDLLKADTATGAVFRVVHLPPKPTGDAPMVLLARFGIGAKDTRCWLFLLEGTSGNTVLSGEGRGPAMADAIHEALAAVQKEAAFMAWRCRVVGVKDEELVLDRGRLDGLRQGQRLIGYALAPEAAKQDSLPVEQVLMQFGTRQGVYEISEVGQEFCRVKPMANAPLLKVGDMLELPAVPFKDRQRDTRSRRIWDKTYE